MIKARSIVWILLLTSSCHPPENKGSEGQDLAAVAGSDKLSREELKGQMPETTNARDSAEISRQYIEHWAREALFYQEAIKKLQVEEMDIERQVEAYRRELVNYIYQSKITEANLDTLISNAEIEEYYNQHKDNFILKENIVKVNYIKVPVKAPAIEKIKKLIYAVTPAEKEQLKVLCIQHADNFYMNDSTWLYLDEIKKEIPALRDQPDYSLSPGRVLQYNDDNYFYYLRINDVKVKNSFSPINFEKQNIKKFILSNRKTQLIIQYKQLLLEKAKKEKKFLMN